MKKVYWALLVFILISLIGVSSIIETNNIHSSSFRLEMRYQLDRFTYPERTHSFDSFYFDISLFLENYSATMEGLRVDEYPLWLDVSEWSQGQNVSIDGRWYVISKSSSNWRCYRDDGDTFSTTLFYDIATGIFTESGKDRVEMVLGGITYELRGYDEDIDIEEGNLHVLRSYMTGTYLYANGFLLVMIFLEFAVIIWLAEHMKG